MSKNSIFTVEKTSFQIGDVGAKHVTGTDAGLKRLLDGATYDAAGKQIGANSLVTGLKMVAGDEISINLGNLTYVITSDVGDQIGTDSVEIPNFTSQDGGVAVLDFLKIQTTVGGTNGKLEFDLLISESVLVTGSADGEPIAIDADNLDKIQNVVQIRESDWVADLGSLDSSAYLDISKLLQKVETVGSASAFFTLVWRGIAFAPGASQTVQFLFGTTYLDTP